MSEADDIAPVGYRYALLMATIFKRVLASDPMTVGERLGMLEALNGMVDAWFTAAGLAVLAPADDATMAIVREAWKLDGNNPGLSPSFDVLTGSEVFDSLVRANPSILAAIKICTGGRDRAPAPQPSETPRPQPGQGSTGQATPYIGPRLERAAEPLRAGGVDFELF
jgi:hypothetical protein